MNKKIIVAFVVVCSCVVRVTAQENAFVIYYDSVWNKVPKENASFYVQFVRKDDFYQSTAHYAKSNVLYFKSAFSDTTYYAGVGNFAKAVDTTLSYYESGILSDSIIVDSKKRRIINEWHYNEKGTLATYVFYDKDSDKWLGQNCDSLGHLILGYFTYQEAAKFPGGVAAIRNYFVRNLRAEVPTDNGAPPGSYAVRVDFIIDAEGKVTDVTAENNPGYGMREEAIRIISKEPQWIPAVKNGKNTTSPGKQSITFQVSQQ